MAELKLKIRGDIEDASKAIGEVKRQLDALNGYKINITISNSSIDSLERVLKDASNAAETLKKNLSINPVGLNEANKGFDKFVTISRGASEAHADLEKNIVRTIETTKNKYGEAVEVIRNYEKVVDEVTKEEIRQLMSVEKVVEQNNEKRRAAYDKLAIAKNKADQQMRDSDRKLQADLLKEFQARIKQEEQWQKEANAYLAEEARAAREAAANAVPTAMQSQIDALTGVSKGYKSAKDSAEIFRMRGLTPLEKELRNNEKAMDDLTGKSESLISNIAKFTRWYLIGTAVSAVTRTIRDAVNTIKEVDQELVNLQKVNPDLTAGNIEEISERAYKSAQKYAVSVTDFLNSVYEFEKAGLGDSAETMAELATKTMLVGDTTSEVANKFLISVNAAWELNGAYDALSMKVDEADFINNQYATDLKKIAEGMPIVASTAAGMNMTFEQTAAALGTITAKTQETGTKAATALRSFLIAASGQIGEFVDDTGETYDITTEQIEALTDALNLYGNEAVKNAQRTGEIINPMEALASLAEAYKNNLITDSQLQKILMDIGGKMRYNQLVTLVKDMASETSTYYDILNKLPEAAGTADTEVAKMMQSWNASAQNLNTAWAQFVDNIINSQAVINFLQKVTNLINNINDALFGGKNKGYAENKRYNQLFGEGHRADRSRELYHQWADAYTSEGDRQALKNIESVIEAFYKYEAAGKKVTDTDREIVEWLAEVIGYTKEQKDSLDDTTGAAKENADAMEDEAGAAGGLAGAISDTQAQMDALEKQTKAVSGALKDYEAYGNLTTDSMKNLRDALPDVTKALFDETGALTDAGKAAFETANKLDTAKSATEYLQTAAERANYSNLISQIEAAGAAAILTAQQIAVMLQAVGMSSYVADAQARGIARTAKEKGVSAQSIFMDYYTSDLSGIINAKISELNSKMSGITASHTKTTKSKSSSSSGSQKDEELERLKQQVSDAKALYTLMEKQGKSEEELAAQSRKVRDALHEQAVYMRSVNGETADSLALSAEWFDWLDKDRKAKLEAYKQAVSLAESELDLLVAQDASTEDQVAKIREIQNAISAQEEYLKSIKADQTEINSLEKKRLDYEEKILTIYERQRKALADAMKEIADSIDKQRAASLEPLKEELETLKANHDAAKEQREEEEKILAVRKAQIDLENANKQRIVRVYNAATDRWERVSNAKKVQEAEKALRDANTELADYYAERAYDEAVSNLEQQIEYTDKAFTQFRNAWEEAAQAIRDGKMSYEEAYAYIEGAMKHIYDTYGVDLSDVLDTAAKSLETEFGLSISALQKFRSEIEAAIKKLAGSGENAEDAVAIFKRFLERALETNNPETAIKELCDAINNGVVNDLGGVSEILAALNGKYEGVSEETAKLWALAKMEYNSAKWWQIKTQRDAAAAAGNTSLAQTYQEAMDALHKENVSLGTAQGWTYDSRTGTWSDTSGNVAYVVDTGNNASGANTQQSNVYQQQIEALMAQIAALEAQNVQTPGGGGSNQYSGISSDNLLTKAALAWNSGNTESAISIAQELYSRDPATYGKILEAYTGKTSTKTTSNSGGSSSGRSSSGGSNSNTSNTGNSNKAIVAVGDNGGNYTITSDKGKNDISSLKVGGSIQQSDGSTWTKMSNGTVRITTKSGNEYYTGSSFDDGGILRGMGRIKATRDDELVLPPDLTKAVLKPGIDANTATVLDRMRMAYGIRPLGSGSITYGGSVAGDTIGTQINMDGQTINFTKAQTDAMSGTDFIAFLASANNLRLYNGGRG